MKVYNSLTRKKEEFKPLVDGEVKMYVVVRNLCAFFIFYVRITPTSPSTPGASYQSLLLKQLPQRTAIPRSVLFESTGREYRFVLCNICVIECMN